MHVVSGNRAGVLLELFASYFHSLSLIFEDNMNKCKWCSAGYKRYLDNNTNTYYHIYAQGYGAESKRACTNLQSDKHSESCHVMVCSGEMKSSQHDTFYGSKHKCDCSMRTK